MKQFRSYAKLRAIHEQRLMPVATKSQNQIMKHSKILIGISLRGYPSTIQAFRFASIHTSSPSAHAECIDPRKDEHNLMSSLQNTLEQYISECKKNRTAPQIWIPNLSALRMWQALCARLRHTQQYPNLCSILEYFTQRPNYAGSQALLPLTTVLKQHWTTGQSKHLDESIETWIHWFSLSVCTQNTPIHSFLAANEEADNPTRPEIIPILRKETEKRTSQVQQLLQYFAEQSPPLISCFSDWWQQDLQYFAAYCTRPKCPRQDSIHRAAEKLEEREFCFANYVADLRREDSAYFYGALLEGHCIEGILQNIQRSTLCILSSQAILRLREGDALINRKNRFEQYRFLSSQWTEKGYLLTLHKTFGQIPHSIGGKIQLTTHAMGWRFQSQRRKNTSQKLRNTGWIHQKDSL